MKRTLTTLIAAATALLAPCALAADPFTVAKVPVDATADTAIQAQTKAIQSGYLRAARILMERLTLDGERAARGLPPLTVETVGPLVRGQTIDNERRSATRYLGDVSIAFNPSAVQQLLRGSNLTLVSSQSRERLAIPVGVDPDGLLADELISGRYAHALTPIRSVTRDEMAMLFGEPSEDQLRMLAARYGVEQVLILRRMPGGVSAVDLSLDTGARDELSAPSLAALVRRMEADWKQAAAVPSDSAQTSTVSVLYGSMEEWQRLQRAINTSAQVRDARLDALSKDGALMTISFGSVDRLAAEMAQKGVRVVQDPELGLVIRR